MVGHDLLGKGDLLLRRRQGEQRPAVPGGEVTLLDEPLDLLGEGQKAHGVGNGGAGSAHPLGSFLLGQAIVLDEGAVACSFLHGVQVLPLEILDQSHRHGFLVGQFPNHHRHFVHAQHSRCTPAAFAGDDLIIQPQRTHQNGLDHAVLLNRIRQCLNGFIAELFAGLVPIGFQFRNAERLFHLHLGGIFIIEKIQTAAQSADRHWSPLSLFLPNDNSRRFFSGGFSPSNSSPSSIYASAPLENRS